MCGRYHIYEVHPESNSREMETRCLCPECAKEEKGEVEIYETDGGVICSRCGREPQERRAYAYM